MGEVKTGLTVFDMEEYMASTDRYTKTIMHRLLKGTLTHERAQFALENPTAFKKQEKEASLKRNRADGSAWPGRYRWWGKVRTKRLVVAYCWAKHRNKAGYFLGWREVYDPKDVTKRIERDQFVARKQKWRVQELQKKRTAKLVKGGAIMLHGWQRIHFGAQ